VTPTIFAKSLARLAEGDAVIIKYDTYAKGKHPQTAEVIEQSYDTVEVLELEAGKVSVIRKYSE
jgi:hypothetical protein